MPTEQPAIFNKVYNFLETFHSNCFFLSFFIYVSINTQRLLQTSLVTTNVSSTLTARILGKTTPIGTQLVNSHSPKEQESSVFMG